MFGGAAHIAFEKQLAPGLNVYNDLNYGLYTFFNVLSDDKKFRRLLEDLYFTPYHQGEWEEYENWALVEDEIERAKQFYARTMQSRSSNGKSWAYSKKTSRRNMSGCVSKWLTNTESYMPEAQEKMSYFEIENLDFEEVIKKYDSEDSLFYVDPPYVTSTRTYKQGYLHEMDNEAHERLVDTLINAKGYVVLSGYENAIYKRLEANGYKKILLKEVVKSSINENRLDNKGKEYIWINYDLPKELLYKHIINEFFYTFTDPKGAAEKLGIDPLKKLTDKRIEQYFTDLGVQCVPSDYYDIIKNFNGGIRKNVFNDKNELFDIKAIFAIDLDGKLEPSLSLTNYIKKYPGKMIRRKEVYLTTRFVLKQLLTVREISLWEQFVMGELQLMI